MGDKWIYLTEILYTCGFPLQYAQNDGVFVFPCLGKHLPGMPGATVGPVPIIRMYGITENGNSVMAHIHGFAPYFFVPAQQGFKREHCEQFRVNILSSHCFIA